MNVTLCDRCNTQGAEWCWTHELDECPDCADTCKAGGWPNTRGLV